LRSVKSRLKKRKKRNTERAAIRGAVIETIRAEIVEAQMHESVGRGNFTMEE